MLDNVEALFCHASPIGVLVWPKDLDIKKNLEQFIFKIEIEMLRKSTVGLEDKRGLFRFVVLYYVPFKF